MSPTHRDPFANLPALRQVASPPAARRLSGLLLTMFSLLSVALLLVPWQQTAPGTGRVLAYAPQERTQAIEATVSGRVDRWFVREGDRVAEGDPIVSLRDNDPELLQRLEQDRETLTAGLDAAVARVRAYQEKLGATEEGGRAAKAAADAKVEGARQKVLAEKDGLIGEEANAEAAVLNRRRTEELAQQGLKSTFDLEQASLREKTAVAKRNQANAKVVEAEANLRGAESDRTKAIQEADAKVNGAQGDLQDALSKEAAALSKLLSMDTKLSRQSAQEIVAPRAGVIQRVKGGQGGEQVKSGDPLAVIVPDTSQVAVEMKLPGNDVPLVQLNQPVRLQFEGWPAIQFSGWPGVAVGTFGGRVAYVDASDDGDGKFRVLIVPDPADEPWPDRSTLRQGVRANGWVLLDIVPLGFELWRQLNGFPPTTSAPTGIEGEAGSDPALQNDKAKQGEKASPKGYDDDDGGSDGKKGDDD